MLLFLSLISLVRAAIATMRQYKIAKVDANVLVELALSLPAWVKTTRSLSSARVLFGSFVTPTTKLPFFFRSRIALTVSILSPDWDNATVISPAAIVEG